jgi:hypothetical protein
MATTVTRRFPAGEVANQMTTNIIAQNPEEEHYTTEIVLDTAAMVNIIPQHLALLWNLKVVASDPREIEVANGVKTFVYGSRELTFRMIDACGKSRLITANFWAIDRPDDRPIAGMPLLTRENIHLHPATNEFRFNVKLEKCEIITASELVAETKRGALVYSFTAKPRAPIVAGLSTEPSNVDKPDLNVEKPLPGELSDEDVENIFWTEQVESTPCAGVEHAIETTTDPPFGPIYNLSAVELEALRQYLEENLAKGWIVESESPAGSPILFVPKKDGGLRLCVDYRGLNKVTIKNRHPLPLIGEILDRLSGATIFTKLDLKDAYHRIPIRREDRWKTAFRTRYGHYEYTVMPFGLTNAPATFQAYIHRALAGMLDTICIVYLDDILIFSRTREEHARHVRKVLRRLREFQLYCNRKKCEFFTDKVEFLGYIVSSSGVEMDARRVAAIAEWPTPKSYNDIQVFLGFTNFYRRFIHQYSKVAAPLTSLLRGSQNGKKSGPFIWPESAEQAFRTLRAAFTTAPLLKHFDPEKPIRLITDASGYALAGILLQPGEEQRWHPVAFWSRKMNGPELNYQTHDQELLAVAEAIKHWRHYLEGAAHAFEVLSDHDNLRGFMSQKTLNRRQARMAITLAPYDFTIKHLAGKSNPADAPSRRPDYAEAATSMEHLNNLLPTLQKKLNLLPEDLVDGPSPAIVSSIRAVQQDNNTQVARQPPASAALDPEDRLITELRKQVIPRVFVAAIAGPSHQGQPGVEPSESLRSLIKLAQSLDDVAQVKLRELAAEPKDTAASEKHWSEDRGLLNYKRRLYVPAQHAIRAELLKLCHDDPFAGHYGAARTAELLKRHFHWEQLDADVEQYTRTCDVCQKVKAKRHKPYGELQSLPRPSQPYEELTLDFIVGLPPSKRAGRVFNAILVVVDRYTKMATYIPTTNHVTAKEVAEHLIEQIVRFRGAPKGIVSDRGPQFTSDFWYHFCKGLGIARRLSTAYHPQTDGQTERQNQTLKTYLQSYVDEQQSNWAAYLHIAEFAYNNSQNSTLGTTPFRALMGYNPALHFSFASEEATENEPTERLQKLRKVREDAEQRWKRAVASQASSYNKQHQPRAFKAGDLVILSTKDLRLKLPSRKLAPRYLGPFKVQDAVGSQAYRLHLPPAYKIHNVFNISRLEPYHLREGNEVPAMPDAILMEDGEEEWEVEKILGKRKARGKLEYHVRWLGWGEEYDSWVPSADMAHAPELIAEFDQTHSKSPAKTRQSTRPKN